MMRRLLVLACLILMPGVVVVYGLVTFVKWVFRSQADVLSEATVSRIKSDANKADLLRKLDDSRVIPPRVSLPKRHTALWRVRGN